MMNKTWGALLGALALAGCGKSVKGTYNMVNGPIPGVVATFGDKTFALSTGASGNYEVTDGNVILSGATLAGTFKIDGDRLVGSDYSFVRRDSNDKTPIAGDPNRHANFPVSGGKGY